MVMQYVLLFARRYWPQLMLPVTIPVGYLGFWMESKLRSRREVEPVPSIVSVREERRLEEMEGGTRGGNERPQQSSSSHLQRTTAEVREERQLQNISSSSSTNTL